MEKARFLNEALVGLTSTYDHLVVGGVSIAVTWEQRLGEYAWHGLSNFRTECGLITEGWSEMDLSEPPPRE